MHGEGNFEQFFCEVRFAAKFMFCECFYAKRILLPVCWKKNRKTDTGAGEAKQ